MKSPRVSRFRRLSSLWPQHALGLALALLARAADVHASPAYTQAIQDSLGLDCPPRCTLCHQDNQGGLGTIRAGSFGETVVFVADLEADDEAALRCALQLLDPSCEEPPACAAPERACVVADTDGDGMTDIDELRQLRDPNTEGEGVLCGASYGCGAELTDPTAAQEGSAVWLTLGMGLVALGVMRRGRGRN